MDEDLRRDLQRLVGSWNAPAPSRDLDRRALDEFRRRRSWWRRIWRSRVVVPVPALAASLVVVAAGVCLTWMALRHPAANDGWEPVAQPKLQVVR